MSELTLKLSVDTTDLDKVEAQLKRINDLLVSTGMKKSATGGFIADTFGVFKCQGGGVFIPEAHISAASISQLSELMNSKAKEAIEKIAKQSPTTTMTITTGVNHVHDQQSITVDLDAKNEGAEVSGVIHADKLQLSVASAFANAGEAVEIISKSERERKEREQKVELRFSELQSQITSTQLASASDIDMLSARICSLDSSIADINSAMATSVTALREEIAQVKANLR